MRRILRVSSLSPKDAETRRTETGVKALIIWTARARAVSYWPAHAQDHQERTKGDREPQVDPVGQDKRGGEEEADRDDLAQERVAIHRSCEREWHRSALDDSSRTHSVPTWEGRCAPVASSSFALSTMFVYRRKRRVASVWKARWIVVRACRACCGSAAPSELRKEQRRTTGCLNLRSERMWAFCEGERVRNYDGAYAGRTHLQNDCRRCSYPSDNVHPSRQPLPHRLVLVVLPRQRAIRTNIRRLALHSQRSRVRFRTLVEGEVLLRLLEEVLEGELRLRVLRAVVGHDSRRRGLVGLLRVKSRVERV